MMAMPDRVYPRKADEVLCAAERVFLAQGYAGTSMTDVADAAGVAKQTVYSNFATKQDLFAAVISQRSAVEVEMPSGLDVRTGDLRAVLVELGLAFLRHICSPGQIELYQTVVGESRQFPELGALMMTGPFVETPALIVETIRQRVETGELDPDRLEDGHVMFIALLRTDVHNRLIFTQPADTSERHLRDIAERAVEVFLHGTAT